MPKSVDLKFLEKMAGKAKRIEDKLGNQDHWAKPFYSDLQVFEPGVPRVFIGLNPGGDGGSKQYYKADRSAKKIRSGDVPYFNAYLDENWGNSTRRPSGRGQAPLQIAAQRVFGSMYGSNWENTLRNTPCFNLVPVCTNNSENPNLNRIWDDGVEWGIELLEYLKPQSIILYANKQSGKSVWRALEQKRGLIKTDAPIDLRPKTFRIYTGVVQRGTLRDVPVIGLPHLSRVNRSKSGISKNLVYLCDRLSELAARRSFP